MSDYKFPADIFTRAANSEYLLFKEHCKTVLSENPNILRLDCLNPSAAIKHSFDFSIVPQISLADAWQQFLNIKAKNYFLSQGVRHSLFILFQRVEHPICIPEAVYPVYEQIAKAAGVPYKYYSMGIIPKHGTILVCDPSPEGHRINCGGLEDRSLIIDRVYNYKHDDSTQALIDNGAIICYSLSKTHLSPLVSGFAVVPPEFDTSSLDHQDDRAKVLLTKYKAFPDYLQSLFQYRWRKLAPILRKTSIVWNEPESGYLARLYGKPEGVLSIPAKVYGSKFNFHYVSCLHESLSLNELEEVDRYYVTVLSNFARGYDKYTGQYSKTNIKESTFPDKFFLLEQDNINIGIQKAKHLSRPDNPLIVLSTKVANHELHPYQKGEFVKRNYIEVNNVYDLEWNQQQIEDVYSRSLAQNKLFNWKNVKPRSMSVLPIANRCQAKCSFCFSHTSVSEDQDQGVIDLNRFDELCKRAADLGANRLVITGGGEPTLMSHEQLLKIMRHGRNHFPKVLLITNGYTLGNAKSVERYKRLFDYQKSGLTNLAISRHSHNRNHKIMKLETHSERVAEAIQETSIRMRWICVLQKQGIKDENLLNDYLDWVVGTNVTEVCFKELYVASSNESVYANNDYNRWCKENQVPMSLVHDFLMDYGAKQVDELPWGSPIFEIDWHGRNLKIALYTEPSVFWERSFGICRSWNLMANGTCYASLETQESIVR